MKIVGYIFIIPLLIFLTTGKDYTFFPKPENIIYGHYSVQKDSDDRIALFDSEGKKLLAEYGNLIKHGLYHGVFDGNVYKIGWASRCLFESINLDYPCADVVYLEKEGEVLLSYEKSRQFFERKEGLSRFISTYGNFLMALILLLSNVPALLSKRSRSSTHDGGQTEA